MAKTVLALYRGTQAAGDAIRALLQRKLHRGDINVISGAVAIGERAVVEIYEQYILKFLSLIAHTPSPVDEVSALLSSP